jgi:hypothetical protein
MKKLVGCMTVVCYGFVAACWIVNLVKLCRCDFEAPYKEEVLHLIGLIPGVSIVTAWF